MIPTYQSTHPDWSFPELRILVFAKAPIPGRVKTRLLPVIDKLEAAKLHRQLIRRTLNVATRASLCPVELWCTPAIEHPEFRMLKREFGLPLRLQVGDNLGQRMEHAISMSLRRAAGVILIGSDCVSLTPDDLCSAGNGLRQGYDVVLGPAEDGGYVLIGLKVATRQLFSRIHWGSNHVLSETRKRIRQSGLSCMELTEGWDLDRPEDLQRYLDLVDIESANPARTDLDQSS